MLQEKYLPVADISKIERIVINAPVEKIFPLIEHLNFENSRLIYWLFRIRGLPVPASMSLAGLEQLNFVKLEKIHNQEIILGLIGRFWTFRGNLQKFKPEEFQKLSIATFAKATWSFEVTKISEFSSQLSTETRVQCPTPKTRKRFRLYWTLIQPFSSLIRREILNSIKQDSERIQKQSITLG